MFFHGETIKIKLTQSYKLSAIGINYIPTCISYFPCNICPRLHVKPNTCTPSTFFYHFLVQMYLSINSFLVPQLPGTAYRNQSYTSATMQTRLRLRIPLSIKKFKFWTERKTSKCAVYRISALPRLHKKI